MRTSKLVAATVVASFILVMSLFWFQRSRAVHPAEPQPSAEVSESSATSQSSETNPTSTQASVTVTLSDELLPVIPIPLAPFLNTAENEFLRNDQNWLSLPHGTQILAGVEFHIDGVIQLSSREISQRNLKYRTSVSVPLSETNFTDGAIQVKELGSNIACLHLLGASSYANDREGIKIAELVWHYADGTVQRTPINHNVHVRDWWRSRYQDRPSYSGTKAVWRGPNLTDPNRTLRLYRLTLPNPIPQKVVKEIDVVSAMASPSLFCLALSLDPLKMGERPDNSPDLDDIDPPFDGRITIYVQDAEDRPIPGAQIKVTFWKLSEGRTESGSKSHVVDANGMAQCGFPLENLERLEVTASHEDYGGRKMSWEPRGGDIIPASYTLKLKAGIAIGGVVVDSNGGPIAGADLHFYRFWVGGDRPNRKGDEFDFPTQSVITDARGQWQVKGLPPELLDHIGFEVSHPDYVGTNYTVGADTRTENELRAGIFKIVLHGGQIVSGRVLDDANNPVAGASVWAGRKYWRERQQTQSDGEGRFSFRNVNEGDTLFSVMASGRKPDSRTVNVHSGMDEIVFRLGVGSVIRARVQNESNEPLSGSRVGLEGNPGEAAYDSYEFSATTDGNGEFQWDSAPNEPMPFYIFHEGYEAKRDVKLKPNEDNVVTLRHTRQLQGQVLDASSGEPVTKFHVRTGHRGPAADSSSVYGILNDRDFSAADGRFSLDLSEEQDDAVLVSADGYSDHVESFPNAQDRIVQVIVRLKPSPMVDGVVLTPEGAPAAGAQVAVVEEGPGQRSVQLTNGRLRSFGQSTIAIADEAGHFHLSSSPESGIVVAVGESGFAKVPIAALRNSGTMILAAWGRIEGTLMIAGKPGTGQDLLFTCQGGGLSTDFNGYKSTVDEQGHFAMEKVPPGDGAVVRLIQTAPSTWTHSHSTPVTIEPGKTTQVTLGNSGGVLTGTVRFETPPTNGESLSISVNLSTMMPAVPPFGSPEESRAYFSSPEWKDLQKQRQFFTVAVDQDHSFVVDSVPPGTYSLNITVAKTGDQPWMVVPPVASGNTTVTVPDSAEPLSPINVGEIVLRPVTAPR